MTKPKSPNTANPATKDRLKPVLKAEKDTGESSVILDMTTGKPIGTPEKRLRGPVLNTFEDVLREMRRTYRAARHGEIPHEQATKQVYMLKEITQVMLAREYKQRIEALEARLAISQDGSADESVADQ